MVFPESDLHTRGPVCPFLPQMAWNKRSHDTKRSDEEARAKADACRSPRVLRFSPQAHGPAPPCPRAWAPHLAVKGVAEQRFQPWVGSAPSGAVRN